MLVEDDDDGVLNMTNKPIHELLPWYVNGSLSVEEQAGIEQAIASSDDLNQEKKFLSSLRQHIKNESCETPGELGLHRLRREIKKQTTSKQTASKPTTKWRVFSIAASLLLVIQLGIIISLTQTEDRFVPLSESNYSGDVIQLQFQDVATISDINQFLLDMDAVIIDGPSKNGIYRIKLYTVNDKTLQAIRNQKNLVDFVAEE